MRQRIDKIASSTRNVTLRRDARLGERVTAKEGYVVAAGNRTAYIRS